MNNEEGRQPDLCVACETEVDEDGNCSGCFTDDDPICTEHGGQFDDNPGKSICKTCEDWKH